MFAATARVLLPLLVTGLGLLAAAGSGCVQAEVEQSAARVQAGEEHLLTLTDGQVMVGVLPEVGGRVVVFRDLAGTNVLHSDPALWSQPAPEPNAAAPFVAYNGHITWIGPQGRWWAHQDVSPQRRRTTPGWPPDPWTVFARCRVLDRGERHVRMEGPVSPVTGLQLVKTVRLTGERTVELTVTATNRRDEPVSWDLWSNTRLVPDGPAYVPVRPGRQVRVQLLTWNLEKTAPLPVRTANGWAFFDFAARPLGGQQKLVSKLFIDPAEGLIAKFHHGWAVLKRAGRPDPKDVHPDQAFVEIYGSVTRTVEGSLLEAEMHGPYRTLAPGESMDWTETWRLVPYEGPATHEARTEWLGRFLRPPDE